MTFAIYIVLCLSVFIGLLNILPDVSALPLNVGPAFSLLISFARAWDYILPIHELMAAMALVITFEVGAWFWVVGWKVIKFLRGHSVGA